jgi:phage shock protein PspC (stress-responsive transcriptional regulator)
MQQYQGNTAIGIIAGMLGGLGKYFLQIQTPFLLNIIGAIITAMLCGAAGVAGKEGYVLIKKFIQKRKKA